MRCAWTTPQSLVLSGRKPDLVTVATVGGVSFQPLGRTSRPRRKSAKRSPPTRRLPLPRRKLTQGDSLHDLGAAGVAVTRVAPRSGPCAGRAHGPAAMRAAPGRLPRRPDRRCGSIISACARLLRPAYPLPPGEADAGGLMVSGEIGEPSPSDAVRRVSGTFRGRRRLQQGIGDRSTVRTRCLPRGVRGSGTGGAAKPPRREHRRPARSGDGSW
jgi:hypothetical protein